MRVFARFSISGHTSLAANSDWRNIVAFWALARVTLPVPYRRRRPNARARASAGGCRLRRSFLHF